MGKSKWSLAIAAAGLLAWWWSALPRPDAAADAFQAHRAVALAETPNSLDLRTERLGLPSPVRDLFNTPPKPPPARRPAPVAQIVETPRPPALPYKYDGSGELQGKRFVYLARDGRASTMVSAGDTLDGTYAVENLARDHAVLRYLPLGVRQVLMYQPGTEPPPELLAEPAANRALALQVHMPAEVVVGQEFVVTVALPGAGAVKAMVEVGYDTEVLRMLGSNLRRPGRAVVEVPAGSASRTELRFKVLADSPALTDIDVQVSATDASGRRIPVSAPPAHTVSLVLPGGA